MSDRFDISNDKTDVIEKMAGAILDGDMTDARDILNRDYPFSVMEISKRSYTIDQKMGQFLKDGFIDRYSGGRLLNPGILKAFSHYFPDDFPYHPHWKTTETHIAYWELSPTIDHIIPIASGGRDNEDNWATTSMMRNAIKSNWSLDQLQWELHPAGRLDEWDGLTGQYIMIVEKDKSLLDDSYIKRWYHASKRALDGVI